MTGLQPDRSEVAKAARIFANSPTGEAFQELALTVKRSAVSAADICEADFQQLVIDCAKLFGWRYYFTHDSRKSPAGFPDLTLIRKGVLIFAELKTEKGQVSIAQAEWLNDLDACAMVRVWRPSDWPEIEATLR